MSGKVDRMKPGPVHWGLIQRRPRFTALTRNTASMGEANQFRHQRYTDSPPTSPVLWLKAPSCPAVGSDKFRRRMLAVGDALRISHVGAVYLSYGTFAGVDASGLF